MPLIPLIPDSPDLAPYHDMRAFRGVMAGEDGPRFICEGRFLVERALQAQAAGQLRLRSIVATESAYGDLKARLGSLFPPELPVHIGDKHAMSEMAGYFFHRGVLCAVEIPPPPPLEALLTARRVVVLPRLDGVDNLGSILRSAAALGMDAVIMGKGPEVFDRRTIRVSMGAAWKIPVFRQKDDEVLPLLEQWRAAAKAQCGENRRETPQVVAAALVEGAVDARHWRPAARTALMLGPEGYGLDDRHLAACDTKVYIPMRAGMDSLNVAACGGMLMYQMGEGS
jgi:tRNA G18 (ribose-2'-O)-methylase SpoU